MTIIIQSKLEDLCPYLVVGVIREVTELGKCWAVCSDATSYRLQKNIGKQALSNVLQGGAEIASHVVAGKKFKDSLKTHSLNAINKTVASAFNQSNANGEKQRSVQQFQAAKNAQAAQSTRGSAKKRNKKRKTASKAKRLRGDIFD